ncbi:efflux RND transporter permease subunit [Citricoccus sp. SGAir0253]|uniref:efflux RND transporter permease subunit n=1 Tax=Citricoccus sp. SGAir0253 TaxID=2567881 RepID=UPI0010CD36A4|nr:efflux RND transporter permease subunit [Citricoccus sp. SGAir0253]QCU78389.1 efflux RND transporter permease subunit [Citricoccus sp. SGAir0253]
MGALARFSLANRALIALVTVLTAVFGVLMAGQLKQELIPSLELPVVSVSSIMPGASPEVVDQQVGEPLESALQAVEGLESSTSTSTTGLNTIALRFEYGTDLNRARAQVDRAVANVSEQLPDSTETTSFAGSISDFPVVFMAVGSEDPDARLNELRSEVERLVTPRLQKVDGVRTAAVTGGTDQHIAVLPDEQELAAAGLGTGDIVTALEENVGLFPIGQVTEGTVTLPVQAGAPVDSLDDVRDVPLVAAGDGGGSGSAAGTPAGAGAVPGAPAGLGTDPGAATGADAGAAGGAPTGSPQAPPAPEASAEPVRLGDVADVAIRDDDPTSVTRTNGVDTLGLSVTKTPDADTVTLSHAINDLIPELETLLGGQATITVVFDQAPFIEQSIDTLAVEGLLGLAFAVLVILVFLASLRSTLVTAISIPLSLLVTFIGMRVSDYSLNVLTLGALTISIGRVVDDSIVVVENIKRHLAGGEDKRTAILSGTGEVATAITASTLTTVAVFAPIALVGGVAGELFRPFAITMTIALLASLLVALTIVPVLSWWFLGRRPRTASGRHVPGAEAGPTAARATTAPVPDAPGAPAGNAPAAAVPAVVARGPLQRAYLPALRGTQRHPVLTLLAALLVLGGTVAMVPLLPTNLLGNTGQNTFTVTATQAPGTSLEATAQAATRVEEVLVGLEGVQDVQWTAGSAGFIPGLTGTSDEATFTVLTDPEADQERLHDEARSRLDGLEGAGELSVSTARGFGTSSDVEVTVGAPSPELLAQATERVAAALEDVDGAQEVSSNLSAARPTFQVDVDRLAAAEAGLTEEEVAGQAAAALNPVPSGTVRLGYTDYPVRIGDPEEITTLEQLRDVQVRTADGPVALSGLAEVSRQEVLSSVTSSDGDRIAVVSVTPAGDDLGAVAADVGTVLEDLDLPEGTTAEVGGAATQQADTFRDLYLALIAAVAIVYVIMVATFKSLVQPLILLVSIPFAATGAIALILLTRTALGLPSLIGMLMLVGIVVTNAIVLIDLINQYRRRPGHTLASALEQGALNRLRPIVMTALATILALTPMALGITGQGGFISQPLAVVVIGGLVSSTLLTLLLVPVLYRLVEGFIERRRARW